MTQRTWDAIEAVATILYWFFVTVAVGAPFVVWFIL